VWSSISEILFVPHAEREYQALTGLLDNLMGADLLEQRSKANPEGSKPLPGG
jgi:hypothetical protein